MKLNLGCGRQKLEGFVNIDSDPKLKPDIVADLEKGLPMIKDNSVDFVYAHSILEHIKNLSNLMEEIYRVCKNNAVVKIVVPFYGSELAYRDPTHVRVFTEKTFEFFDKELCKKAYPWVNLKYDFKVKKIELSGGCFSFLYKYMPIKVIKHLFRHSIDEMCVELIVNKI
ncbi:MAG: methyltransferase domain-containing protein [Hadesarchaea archaeon]|nr:methyltransferase domain-containing protein [Hadesarchaea archaeon]